MCFLSLGGLGKYPQLDLTPIDGAGCPQTGKGQPRGSRPARENMRRLMSPPRCPQGEQSLTVSSLGLAASLAAPFASLLCEEQCT